MSGITKEELRQLMIKNPNLKVKGAKIAMTKPARPQQGSGMNATEAKYAQVLELRRLEGDIKKWEFEPDRLVIATKNIPGRGRKKLTHYIPDFKVFCNDDSVEYHEVKGHMEDDASVKIKVAATIYDDCIFRLVRYDKGAWIIKEYK